MNKIRAVITLILILILAACAAPLAALPTPTTLPATSTSPPSTTFQATPAQPTQARPSTPGGRQADLTVRVRTSLAPPICYDRHSRVGALVVVTNSGDADAGPFMVEVDGIWQAVADGLRAGESHMVWFDGSVFSKPWSRMTVWVDPADQVVESNENNNIFTEPVATLTAPAPCPTATPAPRVTPGR